MKSSNVLITGARGFIGRHLARHLAADGHRVSALGHGIWPAVDAARWGVSRWINGDIQSNNLQLLAREMGLPDLVFHLAGGSSVGAAIAAPAEDFFRTVATTVNLLEWLRLEAPQSRLIAVSSAAVYGAGHAGPIREDAALTPYSPYGHHKLMMESLCRSYGATYGLRSTVARLFSVYGAGLRKQLLWDLCAKLESRTQQIGLGGTGDELRDWVDVRDVVRALACVASLADTQVPTINVGSGLATPVRDVAGQVMAAWHGTVAPPALGFSGQSRSGDPFSLQADAHQLSALGFEWRVPVQQGLADYVQWYQGQTKEDH